MQIAWYSEDRPFAVGYADGRLLIGSKEPSENGSVVVIDAHKVGVIMIHHKLMHTYISIQMLYFHAFLCVIFHVLRSNFTCLHRFTDSQIFVLSLCIVTIGKHQLIALGSWWASVAKLC